MIRSPKGPVVAVGRVHLTSPGEAVIRFMAVEPSWSSRGYGTRILAGLEARAAAAGARSIQLNAREYARRFYSRHGYEEIGPGPTLFDAIRHVRMQKQLPTAG